MYRDDENKDIFRLVVEGLAASHLHDTGRWAKFLAILGFIYSGLMIVLFLMMGSLAPNLSQFGQVSSGFTSTIFYIYTGIIVAISIYPNYTLYMFGKLIRSAIVTSNSTELTRAVGYLKSFFKFIGVICIIAIGFMTLSFIGILMASLSS